MRTLETVVADGQLARARSRTTSSACEFDGPQRSSSRILFARATGPGHPLLGRTGSGRIEWHKYQGPKPGRQKFERDRERPADRGRTLRLTESRTESEKPGSTEFLTAAPIEHPNHNSKDLEPDEAYAFKPEDLEEDEMILNMGPQHPSTHGVLRVELKTDGEVVKDAQPHIGYLHRNFEKHAENIDYQGVIPFTDRLDYVGSMGE